MIDRSKILTVGLASLLGAAMSFAQSYPSTPGGSNPSQNPAENTPQTRLPDQPAPPQRDRAATSGAQTNAQAGESETYTGCVQRGSGANQFTLSSPDGRMWMLTGDTSKLEPHVGHTVTVTGMAQGGANSSSGTGTTPRGTGSAGNAGGAADRRGDSTGPTGAESSSGSYGTAQSGAAGSSSSAAASRGQLSVSNVTMVSNSCQASSSNRGAGTSPSTR